MLFPGEPQHALEQDSSRVHGCRAPQLVDISFWVHCHTAGPHQESKCSSCGRLNRKEKEQGISLFFLRVEMAIFWMLWLSVLCD